MKVEIGVYEAQFAFGQGLQITSNRKWCRCYRLMTEASRSYRSVTFQPQLYTGAIDPEQPSQRKRYAGSVVLCSRHDNPCYAAYLYLILFNFNWIDYE